MICSSSLLSGSLLSVVWMQQTAPHHRIGQALVGAAQPMRHVLEDTSQDLRAGGGVMGEKLIEAGTADFQEHAVGNRVDGGGSGAGIEEAQLAEATARLEPAEENLAPAADPAGVQEPVLDDEQRGIALPLREDLLALAECDPLGARQQRTQLVIGQGREKPNPFDDRRINHTSFTSTNPRRKSPPRICERAESYLGG